jgi:hypothetical protein
MAVNIDAKTRLLKRRVSALTLPESALHEAAVIVDSNGLKLPGVLETLRLEWLNDMLATDSASKFSHAARNPTNHFIEWIKVRSLNRYHVSYRSVDTVGRRLGLDAASRLAVVIWPQEIAWAQRMRTFSNPSVATKAALFLREAEGQPSRIFEKIADVFADAYLRSDYIGSSAHALSVSDIRFSEDLPEFTPLFLRYAARAYSEKLLGMSRDRIASLALIAARDELSDRNFESARQSSKIAIGSPMRRMVPIISAALRLDISSNELFVLETTFVEKLLAGAIPIELGTGSPHGSFLRLIEDRSERSALLADAAVDALPLDPDALAWEVVNFRPSSWLREIPDSIRIIADKPKIAMERWQTEIADDVRTPPFDPVSDFGFFLLAGGAK